MKYYFSLGWNELWCYFYRRASNISFGRFRGAKVYLGWKVERLVNLTSVILNSWFDIVFFFLKSYAIFIVSKILRKFFITSDFSVIEYLLNDHLFESVHKTQNLFLYLRKQKSAWSRYRVLFTFFITMTLHFIIIFFMLCMRKH